jgi:hypothetical protein
MRYEPSQQYLDSLYAATEDSANYVDPEAPLHIANATEDIWNGVDWNKAVPVPSTVKELSVGASGEITYSYSTDQYGGGTITAMFEDCFTNDKTAQSKIVSYMESDTSLYAIRFSKDASGAITGAVVIPE